MKQQSEYFQEQEQDSDDDLADFAEYKQNKIVEQVMNFGNQIEDDIQYIQSKNEPKVIEQKEKKISEEQRYARQLRLLNARKYFQIINLMYLQKIVISLKLFKEYKNQQSSYLSKWLSLLNQQLIKQFIQFKQTKALSIKIKELLQFLKKAKNYIISNNSEEKLGSLEWSNFFWAICQSLNIVCRKVFFFDIDGMVEEIFFKLKYLSSQRQRKRQNKKRKEHQIIKISIDQKIQQNLQGQDSNKYLFFQDFQFDEASFNTKRKSKNQTLNKQVQSRQMQNRQQKRENNFLRKRNYKESCYQLYDIVENKWIFVNSEILQYQNIEDFKKIVLQGKFIIGFYSLRILHFREEYKQFCVLRLFEDIIIEDLTMHFCDNFKNLSSRRKRIGVKSLMRQIFSKASFQKHRFMLEHYDQLIFDQNDKLQLQYQIANFPKSKQEMLVSQYFIIPSMLPQYCILDSRAIPLQLQFHEQKVYLKRDMIAVTSRNGWIDRGRMVKQNEVPVKKTQNKSKNMTELFLYEQTMPFFLRRDLNTGHFIADDEYNNIYVPPDFIPPEDLTIINKKISYVCSRAKINHVQLVQGFNRTIGRILPNYIGYLVYKKDEAQIERLQAERQAKMDQNKSNNRQKQLIAIWNKVFKKIQLSEWSKSFDHK